MNSPPILVTAHQHTRIAIAFFYNLDMRAFYIFSAISMIASFAAVAEADYFTIMNNVLIVLVLILPLVTQANQKTVSNKKSPSQVEIITRLEKGMAKIFDCFKQFAKELDQYIRCARESFSNTPDRNERMHNSSGFVPLVNKRETVRNCNSVEKEFIQRSEKAAYLACMNFTDAMGGSRVAFIMSSDGVVIDSIRAF